MGILSAARQGLVNITKGTPKAWPIWVYLLICFSVFCIYSIIGTYSRPNNTYKIWLMETITDAGLDPTVFKIVHIRSWFAPRSSIRVNELGESTLYVRTKGRTPSQIKKSLLYLAAKMLTPNGSKSEYKYKLDLLLTTASRGGQGIMQAKAKF